MEDANTVVMNNNVDSLLTKKMVKREMDPIISIFEKYNNCKDDKKINLTVGAYRDENLKPYVFNCVRKAENDLIGNMPKEYPPSIGDEEFLNCCRRLFFNDDSKEYLDNRIVSCQSFAGTGSVFLIMKSLKYIKKLRNKTVYITDPTWSNHLLISDESHMKYKEYSYYDQKNSCLNLNNILNTIETAENESIFILHSCSHNPTGCDPTKDEWEKIMDAINKKNHFVIFDTAYQGFATGDLEDDIFAIRLACKFNLDLAICQSFSKNMGMYGERAGAVHIVIKDYNDKLKNKELTDKLRKIFEKTALSTFLVPDMYGAYVIKRVLTNYYSEWKEELKKCINRLQDMRNKLYQNLVNINTPGNWDHIKNQRGMFAYSGLTYDECDYLINTKNTYLLYSGRISLCGINDENVLRIAEYIKEARLYCK